MRTRFLLAALLAGTSAAAFAEPVPKDQLMVPPESAQEYLVVSPTNTHGSEWMWTTDDGALAYRKSQSLRGWITETDALVRLDDHGMPVSLEVRGVTTEGDAAETFSIADGSATWSDGIADGEAPAGKFYLNKGGPGIMMGTLAEALYDHEGPLDLYPGGSASMRLAKEIHLEDESGDQHLGLYYIDGLDTQPRPVWLTADGDFFAYVGYMGLLPKGYEEHYLSLKAIQEEIAGEEVRAVAAQFLTDEARKPLLIDNVMLFDADAGAFVADQAVMVEGGKIVAVGPAGSIAPVKGARLIDGRGKSLVPGLWDSHAHVDDGYGMLQNLAYGHTSHRSPGMGIEDYVRLEKARKAGEILAPETFAAQIIDAVHPLSAQGATLVDSEEAAIEAVREIHDAGMWGVKFYTSMNPDWIAPAAAEAHRLGMHVAGHIPATMRPLDAVRAGYDEITHLNFAIMQALPQSVVDVSNTAARFEGPAQYGKDVDLDSDEMKAFIAELVERGTIVDPTIMIFEGWMTMGDERALAPAYGPYAGTMPVVFERGLYAGGYPLFADLKRKDFAASYAKMLGLIDRLHEAGVPLVAGTDGYGMELVREIELYEQAGLSKEEALRSATIVPAEVVGVDERTGSIRVGKEADLLLVDGDVSADLGALRRIDLVVSDGVAMDGDALRKAAGFSGRSK
ncbi:amidohydrolase family protein [Sphingomicrobium nitratireducens]|uniref:amidohydrolase family protein n=1 Tax=Sphingomicrobium nitratireducens TaxID=2964666 RepID=UPI00223FCEBE|nr:amidohydrolase family protein [Sphingomicrobium nitratireducens]